MYVSSKYDNKSVSSFTGKKFCLYWPYKLINEGEGSGTGEAIKG